MVAILFVHFGVLVLVLRERLVSWRTAWCAATLVGGIELVTLTESLSPWRLLQPGVLAIAWLALTVAWCAWAALRTSLFKRNRIELPRWPEGRFERVILIGIGIIVGLSLMVAVTSPPNNWDSLTYHMSRVMQWKHHQSVAHYPTHILRQLHLNPFAEYVILHLQILVDGDRFANVVQWGFWVTGMMAASLLARDLGGDRRSQLLAALFVATLPMAVLQATNTQNDLVLGGVLLILAWAVLRIVRTGVTLPLILAAASAAGLALLTKGTAYLFIAPWLLLMTCILLYRQRQRAIPWLAGFGVVVIALNGGHWLRNYHTYGSILGAKVEHGTVFDHSYANESFGPATLASNLVRNTSLHTVGTFVDTGSPMEAAVGWIHRVTGMDINDPRTTWAGEKYRLYSGGWNNLEHAGNPWHVVLIAGCAAAVAWRRRAGWTVVVATMAMVGYVAFCWYLRWQPWHSRLQTPLFMLIAAPVGIGLGRVRQPLMLWAVAIVLLVGAAFRVAGNRVHPFYGSRSIFEQTRLDQYIDDGLRPYFIAFGASVDRLQLDRIGLVSNIDELEYLLWVYGDLQCVKHVEVTNVSAKLPPDPCEPTRVFILKLDQQYFGLRRLPGSTTRP